MNSNKTSIGLSIRLHGGLCTLGNLMREWRANPSRMWRRHRNPWARLADPRQFDDLLARYPLAPLDSTGCRIGILKGYDQQYRRYENACRELNVPHQVLDVAASDWLAQVRASGCNGFIAHPTPYTRPMRDVFAERLHILSKDLGLPVHPDDNSLWLYESKRRMAYWLEAHDVPHPATHVFYDRKSAFTFASAATYPMICKTDLGSSAGGVFMVRRRGQAFRLITRAFGAGLLGRGRDPRDREWSEILFQTYIPNAREFRVIQIGDSWFAHEKIAHAETGFHSGSGTSAWNVPPDRVFDFCREAGGKGGFRAMNYDVFMTPAGELMINELQAVFAAYNPSQMYRDGIPGRMVFADNCWHFEEGVFCRNGCANLRVAELVGRIRAQDVCRV